MTEKTHYYVSIELASEEVARLRATTNGNEFGDVLEPILIDRIKVWRKLADHFMQGDARFTLIDDSVQIEQVHMPSPFSGFVEGTFQMAAYYGCRDLDGSADGEFTLEISIDWYQQKPTILIGAKRRAPDRDTFEEF